MNWINEAQPNSGNAGPDGGCGAKFCWENSEGGACVVRVCLISKFCPWDFSS